MFEEQNVDSILGAYSNENHCNNRGTRSNDTCCKCQRPFIKQYLYKTGLSQPARVTGIIKLSLQISHQIH